MDSQIGTSAETSQTEDIMEANGKALTRLGQIPEDDMDSHMNLDKKLDMDNAHAAGSAVKLKTYSHTPSFNSSLSNNDDGSIHGLYRMEVSTPRASLLTRSSHDSDDKGVNTPPVSPARVPLPFTPITPIFHSSFPTTSISPSSSPSHTQTHLNPKTETNVNDNNLRVPNLQQTKSFTSSLKTTSDAPSTSNSATRMETCESAGTSTTTLMPPDENISGAIIAYETMPMPDDAANIVQIIKDKEGNMDGDIESQNEKPFDNKTKHESPSPTLAPSKSSSSEQDPNFNPEYEVLLEPKEDPKNLPKMKKWTIVLLICLAAFCVTCASSAVRLRKFSSNMCLKTDHI